MTDKERKFIPVGESQDGQPAEENKEEKSIVEQARESAEVQKYETERIEAQQRAIFAQNTIKDTEDLAARLTEVSERESKLGRDVLEFENRKATELSEIQKHEAELKEQDAELKKRAQELANREANVQLREKLVSDREALMTDVEKKELNKTEKYNSLTEQLKRSFSQVILLMSANANILIKAGFRGVGNGLWDEIEQMQEWHNNGIEDYCDTIVEWLKEEVVECNDKAVVMARNPKQYGEVSHNRIVDNLERIYELLPALKPEYLPSDDE